MIPALLPLSDMSMTTLRDRINQAINMESAENGSDTPDFILAEYLVECLAAFDKAVRSRESWYGRYSTTLPGIDDHLIPSP